jgi:hypothetical protein
MLQLVLVVQLPLDNLTAAMIFNPKKVIVIAEKNKIVGDVDAGIVGIRNVTAPMSTHRGKEE